MNSITTYFYNESPIQFDWIDGQLMANATLMGKPYNVKPTDIFKQKSWANYQKALSERKGYRFDNLRTVKNGDQGGSWIHQELVIEFARRLSPDFSIWCNDKIAELLKEGKTEIEKPKSQIELLLASVQALADQDRRVNAIENRMEILEAKSITSPIEYYSVAGFWSLNRIKIDSSLAKEISYKARKICNDMGYQIGKVPDAKYGTVNTYPAEVLQNLLPVKNLSKN